MHRRNFVQTLLAASASGGNSNTSIDRAFTRLYEFDFKGVQDLTPASLNDPLANGVRAAAILFREFQQLNIWEGEDFFETGKRSKAKPNVDAKTAFYGEMKEARRLADEALRINPKDTNALFTQTMTYGLETDYIAFVERRSLASFEPCKTSQRWADKLLAIDPGFHDAYLTTGVNEYMLGALPGILRWAVKVETAKGDKKKGLEHLEMVAKGGRYFPAFAKLLMAVFYEREKQASRAEAMLLDLSRSYPQNDLFRRQLQRMRAKVEKTISR